MYMSVEDAGEPRTIRVPFAAGLALATCAAVTLGVGLFPGALSSTAEDATPALVLEPVDAERRPRAPRRRPVARQRKRDRIGGVVPLVAGPRWSTDGGAHPCSRHAGGPARPVPPPGERARPVAPPLPSVASSPPAGGASPRPRRRRRPPSMLLSDTTLPDVELVELARSGDRSAFDELLRRHDGRMRGLAYKLMADRHRMDDALQEAYLKAYRALPRFRPGSDFGTWLYRITYNACIDELRKRKRHPVTTDDPVDPGVGPPGPGAGGQRRRRPCAARSPTCRSTSGSPSCSSTARASTTGRPPRSSASRPARSPPACTAPVPRSAASWGRRCVSDDEPEPAVEPDGVVRTALQLLPIPAHDDDFWARLEAALDAEPPHEPAAEPCAARLVADAAGRRRRSRRTVLEPDPALAVVPAGLPPHVERRARRWSPPPPSWSWPSPAPPCSTTSAAPPSAPPSRRPTPPSRPSCGTPRPTAAPSPRCRPPREDDSSEAVLAWVDDLGDGRRRRRVGRRWATVSQAHFGSQAEFEGAHDRSGRGLRRLVGRRARRGPRDARRRRRRRHRSRWSRSSAPSSRRAPPRLEPTPSPSASSTATSSSSPSPPPATSRS